MNHWIIAPVVLPAMMAPLITKNRSTNSQAFCTSPHCAGAPPQRASTKA